jgi:hypothetical protein
VSRILALDITRTIVTIRDVKIPGPTPRKLRLWEMNPHDVQVEDETSEDVYCPNCNVIIAGMDVRWFSGESEGEGECPECGTMILVPEPEIEPDFDNEPIGRYWE